MTFPNGLVVMVPSGSPAYVTTGAGSSATVGANGKVTFSLCQSLSLNNVFTTAYDNYMVVCAVTAGSTTSINVPLRLRTAGSDASTAIYTWQWIESSSTSVTGLRTASATEVRVGVYAETGKRQAATFYVFGPRLAQPTAFRGVSAGGYLDAYIADYAGTHNFAGAYDGFTLFPLTGTFDGYVTVYGFNQ